MKKFLLSVAAILIACAASGQVLYSISGNGLKKESYIVGTHHLVDASFVKEIPGMDKAMKMTEQVYGELKMSEIMNPDTMKMMQEALYIPDGRKIKELLDPEHFDKLNELFRNLAGVPFDFPQIYEQMGRMRPSALESQLTVLMYLAEHSGAFDPTQALDSYFQNVALEQKKQTYGLETFEYQIKMMYQSKPVEEEVRSLNCLLDNIDYGKKQLDMLTEAYKAQDANAIDKALKMGGEIECMDSNLDELIDVRNKNWVAKMPEIMKNRPTLFVVGAGHLFGEKGVLELLKKAGYTIKAVTK